MAVFGVIADDFTGASDAASFLVKGGLSVRLVSGVPAQAGRAEAAGDAQAVVVALKSRTQETGAAVVDSLAAADFLLEAGVQQIYFKYCSTFDSTPRGNIGPVADALMERMGARVSVLCPSLPVNGRTVRGGCLYVSGVPLHESPMKDHPLTPMWDSDLTRLMAPQSHWKSIRATPDVLARLAADPPREPCYLVPDYETDADGAQIAAAVAELPLLTGGSGLLAPLAEIWADKLHGKAAPPESGTHGDAILLAGSCSRATLGQIAWYQTQGLPSRKLDPVAIVEGRFTVDDLWPFVAECRAQGLAPLVFSSDTPDRVRAYQALGAGRVSGALERFTAALARRAAEEGFTRIISAGGETSGAVTQALGFQTFLIGRSVAPGVPVMTPAERREIRLVLKSGNFGQEDFFCRALEMTSADAEEKES